MQVRLWAGGLAAAALMSAAGAQAATAADSGLDAYAVPVTAKNIEVLRSRGFDLHEGRVGRTQEIVATASQAQGLAKEGVKATLKRDAAGKTERQRAERGVKPDGSYDVYRPYFDKTYVGKDANGKVRETLYEEYQRIAAEHPNLVRIQEIGRTLNNKPIIALRITKDVRDQPRGARPSVLYIANQHAREWITAENVRRQINHLVDDYGTDEKVTRLVNTRELWYVPIANPDGYDFTFTKGNRLWRKNLHEFNGIQGTQAGDGVDPNRNYPGSWGLDDEGSSPDPSNETYRGTGPASELETQAVDRLMKQQDFKMLVNYHSAAELLLYGRGNYVEGEVPDDPIYEALSGTDADSAIKGVDAGAPDDYDPDISAELYTTNGDTDEYAYEHYGILSWTPEMDVADQARGAVGEDGGAPSVFEFQDSDADLNSAYEKNLPFMEDVADSAANPVEPVSHLGNTVADFELRPFDTSYGAPQTVSVLAKKKLGAVTVKWSINNGEEQSAPTSEFKGGERFGGGGTYFHEVRGVVTGAKAGDTVRVRFEAGGKESGAFRYTQASDTDAPVLLLASENEKGTSAYPPVPAGGLLAFNKPYEAALTQAGIKFDTWDVDARGGAPDELGVLSHYKAVVWYTGNDLLTRNPGQPGATGAAKFGNDVTLAVRSYLNEGGKLLYTGQNAAFQNTQGVYAYNPQGEPPYCDSADPAADYTDSLNRCVLLSNDFLQYWVGAYIHSDIAGSTGGDVAADKADVAKKTFKLAAPFGDADFTLNGGDSADNQAHLTTAVTTSSILGSRFKDQLFAGFDGPGAFSPPSGTGYAVAQSDDEGWQRLRKTVDLTGKTSGALQFNLSYDAEIDYDYVFVEAHTVGQDDWTTLPDRNGNTAKDAGGSCTINWRSLHPFVDHYQTVIPAPVPDPDKQGITCDPEGTTGEFNAATGNSGGYKPWDVDLSAYAGKQVELSITYAQDFAVSGLGAYLDDVKVLKDGAVAETTGFEAGDTGGFTAGPPPAGSEAGTQGAWKSTQDLGLKTGPGVATPDTVYLTFGFEGISTATQRSTVMTAAMKHLGVIADTPPAPAPPTTTPPPAPPAPPAPVPPVVTPPAPVKAPLVTLTLGAFRVSPTGKVPFRVKCPATASIAGCTGTVSIRVGSTTYGSVTYKVPRGGAKTVSVKLTKSALRAIKRRKSTKVTVRVSSKSAGRATVVTTRTANLKRPK